jgi:hypothetical protein
MGYIKRKIFIYLRKWIPETILLLRLSNMQCVNVTILRSREGKTLCSGYGESDRPVRAQSTPNSSRWGYTITTRYEKTRSNNGSEKTCTTTMRDVHPVVAYGAVGIQLLSIHRLNAVYCICHNWVKNSYCDLLSSYACFTSIHSITQPTIYLFIFFVFRFLNILRSDGRRHGVRSSPDRR